MQIALDPGTSTYRISEYGHGFVVVNEQRVEGSLVITPETLNVDWGPTTADTLEALHIEELTEFEPEIAILGTGERQQFPSTEILLPFVEAHIGFEIMDTRAACRTYNILMAEGRNVLAALLMIRS